MKKVIYLGKSTWKSWETDNLSVFLCHIFSFLKLQVKYVVADLSFVQGIDLLLKH